MLHREPEYRRRIRDQAEQNEKAANREWDEANQKRRHEEAIAAIKRIEEKLARAEDEGSPKNKSDRRWHKAEVFGLWAAAIVGLAAILWASHDSSEQRTVMQGQLDEMRRQQLLTRTQMAANMRRDDVIASPYSSDGRVSGWNLNAHFRNTGGTDARGFSSKWDVYVARGHVDPSDTCRTLGVGILSEPPGPKTNIYPGMIISLSARQVSADDMTSAENNTAAIFAYGRAEYRDIFPDSNLHHAVWCILVIPNDIRNNAFSFFTIQEESN